MHHRNEASFYIPHDRHLLCNALLSLLVHHGKQQQIACIASLSSMNLISMIAILKINSVQKSWSYNKYMHLLLSIFRSMGNFNAFIIFAQPSSLKSKHFKCSTRTTGSSSIVTCCHASTSSFVLEEVTPSSWFLLTRASKASFTEATFCKLTTFVK